MPPKQKFTDEEIISTALELVRKNGIGSLTARGLGMALGTSSRPIFTAFRNMEELQEKVILAAKSLYNGYIAEGLSEEPAFKGVGKQYFRFAQNEPRLFELLFMTADNALTLAEVIPAIDDNSENILLSIQEPYGISREKAYKLYQNMWVYTHGLACLCATGVSYFSDEEVSIRLTDVFTSQLIKIKSEESCND